MKTPRTGTTPTHGSSATSETAPTPAAASGSGSASGTEPERVTATVTWPHVYTSPLVFELNIPTFLWRGDSRCPAPVPPTIAAAPASPTPNTPTAATAPVVSTSAGTTSGDTPGPSPAGHMDFSRFKVEQEDIERQIKREADRRWHQWEGPHRPRKSTVLRQVRKEFYK